MLKQKISSKDHHSRQDSVRLARWPNLQLGYKSSLVGQKAECGHPNLCLNMPSKCEHLADNQNQAADNASNVADQVAAAIQMM